VTTPTGAKVEKSDPVGAATEEPPSIASVIADLSYEWNDDDWMASRGDRIALDAPVSIYEVHLGSWGRHVTDGKRFPRYDELADPIADHVLAHGFTHVEFLPIMEHPFYGSWGYQTTGFFAPSARYGSPVDLMRMIDRLHQRGVGVILDWVPSHFPNDSHGLYEFDGTHLFEHCRSAQGYHPDWNSAIFNYSRNEVRSFLVSSAMCWLDRYHVDGLRVDAVASMLYLDYSRKRASGSRTSSAVARTSMPSCSCASSTKRSTASSRTWRPMPRSRRRGRWSPADLHRRPRLRLQMGHGVDARHAVVHAARSIHRSAGTTARSRSVRCTRSASTSCSR
jgi:alpha-1,4-glucan:alpha-1,4-glucan 6-glycosyltransferase